MRFSLTTWNINSVRLRIGIVAKFLKSVRPDVLCLQETKCIDDAFPLKRFKRLGYEHVMGAWWIWKFSQNKAAAKKFLADLEINYRAAFIASKFYNFPSFPGAVPFKQIRKLVAQDKHRPLGKYSILATIAQKYTTNPGYPGYTNAAP